MNQINVKRMLLAGLVMFGAWIAIEFLLEGVISQVLFGQASGEIRMQAIDVRDWSVLNGAVNLFIGLLNCVILIWLYASLRPMYGVGTRAALITSAFFITWLFSMFVNLTNLGVFPPQFALMEAIFEAIEFPIAMIVGAGVYEGQERGTAGV